MSSECPYGLNINKILKKKKKSPVFIYLWSQNITFKWKDLLPLMNIN